MQQVIVNGRKFLINNESTKSLKSFIKFLFKERVKKTSTEYTLFLKALPLPTLKENDILLRKEDLTYCIKTIFSFSKFSEKMENLVKHEKFTKYYDHGCLKNFPLHFVSLLTVPINKSSHVLARTCFMIPKERPRPNSKALKYQNSFYTWKVTSAKI